MMQYMRPTTRGFTLVEMLIVVSIIVTLSALSIPLLARTGLLTSSGSRAAARDLYQMLRATRLYATTNNVETALVYRTRMVYETANDEEDPIDITPVIDGYAICRRLSPDEVRALNAYYDDGTYNITSGEPFDGSEVIYIPIEEGNGRFRDMPDNMVVLGDVFQFSGVGQAATNNSGLDPVYVADPFAGDVTATGSPFIQPTVHINDTNLTDGVSNDGDAGIDEPDEAERLHFDIGDGDLSTDAPDAALATLVLDTGDFAPVHAFPAHRFAATGEMITETNRQRFEMRVGLVAEELPQDRFVIGDNSTVIYVPDPTPGTPGDDSDVQAIDIRFHRYDPADPQGNVEEYLLFYDPRRLSVNPAPPPDLINDRDPDVDGFNVDPDPAVGLVAPYLLENTFSVIIYASTGRVKVEADT